MIANCIVIVKCDKRICVAQYADNEGEPSNQGVIVLEFLKHNSLLHFKRMVTNLKEVGDKLIWKYWDKCKVYNKLGNVVEDLTRAKYNSKYPHLTPHIGGMVLQLISNGKVKEVLIEQGYDVEPPITDWSYTIDFDSGKLIVFGDTKKTYNLNNLPTTNQFLFDLGDEFPSE
jgi:hypothetical protein